LFSTITDPEAWLMSALGGQASKSGITVTRDNALQVSAAYACVNVISAAVGCLSWGIFKTNDKGGRDKDKKHPAHKLMNVEWNDYLTAYRGWRIVMANALLTEAGYIEVVRKSGKPVALYPIPSKYVTKKIDRRTLRPEYVVQMDGMEAYALKYNQVIEIPGLATDGFIAYQPISLLREVLGLAIAAEEYASEYFANGTHPPGVITYKGGLNEDQEKAFKSEIRAAYSGLGKSQRLMLLEEGMKYEKVSSPPIEGQMIESRKFQVTEMARFFNVPPHKIMDLDRATWNNIEEMNLSFAQDTLMPWIKNIEQAAAQALIFPSEREAGTYIEADLNVMLRGRQTDRFEAYAKALANGWLSINEVRAKENLPEVPGGDDHYVPLNMRKLGEGA